MLPCTGMRQWEGLPPKNERDRVRRGSIEGGGCAPVGERPGGLDLDLSLTSGALPVRMRCKAKWALAVDHRD